MSEYELVADQTDHVIRSKKPSYSLGFLIYKTGSSTIELFLI